MTSLMLYMMSVFDLACEHSHTQFSMNHQPLDAHLYLYYAPETSYTGDVLYGRSTATVCQSMTDTDFIAYLLASGRENRSIVNRSVDYIIPLGDDVPEKYRYCDRSIRGNMIMANSTWIDELETKCWRYAHVERRAIYGGQRDIYAYGGITGDMYMQAELAVLMCCDR